MELLFVVLSSGALSFLIVLMALRYLKKDALYVRSRISGLLAGQSNTGRSRRSIRKTAISARRTGPSSETC